MVRKVNKGVSMVEVLIALAIFMIMMIPLVSALLSGMKTTTTAKELQYRNEFAQNLLESVKEVSITVLDGADTSYFEKMGATGVTITHATDDTTHVKTNLDGTITQCPYEEYEITGKTYLGVERTEYSYVIEMSSEAYAEAQALGSLNPNNLTSGIVEDLDQTKVALISATLANYDTPAYSALLTKKMSELRKKQEENGIAYDPVNDVRLFDTDTGNRIINIAVKGNAASGYDVTCTVSYSDNCGETSSETGKTIGEVVGMVEYVPYTRHFEELSNIYLMYNVGVYNGQYTNDYITFDLSDLDDQSVINAFVIETAANYSSDVVSTNDSTGENWLKSDADVLYRKASAAYRDGATIGMALLDSGLSSEKLNNFHVYHNMAAPSRSDYESDAEYNAAVAEWNTHTKNVNVVYDDTVATRIQNLFSNPASHVYKKLTQVGTLNQAQSGNRGLYEVKIWMQKGDVDAATLKAEDPILQGTRGGSEID